MKSFATFQEDLTDRRQQLLQRQKAQKQSSAERGAKSRASFEITETESTKAKFC